MAVSSWILITVFTCFHRSPEPRFVLKDMSLVLATSRWLKAPNTQHMGFHSQIAKVLAPWAWSQMFFSFGDDPWWRKYDLHWAYIWWVWGGECRPCFTPRTATDRFLLRCYCSRTRALSGMCQERIDFDQPAGTDFGHRGHQVVELRGTEEILCVLQATNKHPRDPSSFSEGTWTLQTHPKHLLRRYLDP